MKRDRAASSDVQRPGDSVLPEEGQDYIEVGSVYREKNGQAEVVPFFVDLHTARVRFAPVGRSTEDEMRTSDFLNRFEYQGLSSTAERPAEKEA